MAQKICFDVDGTLVETRHETGMIVPRYAVIELFKNFQKLGWDMYLWSGGGMTYARQWRDKLGLEADVAGKGSFVPDIAVDDQEVKLGVINIQVGVSFE
jgi:hydroxymethylpyrimidine pyrophosphatase-like HAD family hydrolase